MATDQQLIDLFESMDTNSDGALSKDEVQQFLLDKNYGAEFVNKWLSNFYLTDDGKVTLEEFISRLDLDPIPSSEKESCVWSDVFRRFDKDNSGYIESHEIPLILEECHVDASKYSYQQFQTFIAKHDEDNDGRLDYNEFLHFIRGH